MSYAPLSQREELIAKHTVHAAYTVHKHLGPGLLEKVYEACFCHELRKAGLDIQKQLKIPIVYDGLIFEEALQLDVLIEDLVICELKAVDQVNPVWKAQVLSHLKLSRKRLGGFSLTSTFRSSRAALGDSCCKLRETFVFWCLSGERALPLRH